MNGRVTKESQRLLRLILFFFFWPLSGLSCRLHQCLWARSYGYDTSQGLTMMIQVSRSDNGVCCLRPMGVNFLHVTR